MHCGIDFDRSVAEISFHIIADDRLRLFTIAETELFLSQRSSSLPIVDDHPITEKYFHIIADDR